MVFNEHISINHSLKPGRYEYQPQEHRCLSVSADDKEGFKLAGLLSMTGQIPACYIDTDKDDDKSDAWAFAWKQDVGLVTSKPEVLRGQLAHLYMGHSPSIFGPTATPALSNHAAKGKGKEVDTPIESDPLTVPASEKLQSFMQKAEERRAAAKAAAMQELAAMERKHIDEKVKLMKEQSETQQLLEEDIAAELEALRFEAQMEGS